MFPIKLWAIWIILLFSMRSKQQNQPSSPPHKSHRNYDKLFESIDHTYSSSSHRIKRNPEIANLQYLKSKQLQSRSNINSKHYPFFTVDNASSHSVDTSKIHRTKTINYLKLPVIKSNNQPNQRISPYQKFNPRRAYLQPTANSRIKQKQPNLSSSASKRICSVNCLRKHTNQKRQKKTNKKTEVVPVIRKYLAEEAEANYPATQINRYLSRMRDQQQQKYGKLVYQTYFGIQPQFYKLQTEYARQLAQPADFQEKIDDKVRTQIPLIPSQQELANFIQEYQPFNKQIAMQKLMKSPRFLVQYSRIELFFGEMIGNSKEGMGVVIQQGKVFQGVFRNNFKVRGVQINSSGVYRGQFFNQKRSGDGEFEWLNGEYYIGEWKEGHRHGTGVWTNKFGDSYNGEWKMGKGEGYGIYIVGGQEYKGYFVDFKKQGWGREKFISRDCYEGQFRQGLPEGKGRYTWSNGTKYEGEFITGLRNGKGSLKTPDGFYYKGEFLDEKPQGLCQIYMPNGDTYHGYLREGKKNGRGTLFLRDTQNTLDGFWQDDNFISPYTG